jgi:glucokinase
VSAEMVGRPSLMFASPVSPRRFRGARSIHPQVSSIARTVLAFDVGGTKLAAAVVDEGGAVRSEERAATPHDGASLYAELERLGRSVIERSGARIDAIGAGCGGPMRYPEGIVSPLHITQWKDFPLRSRLEASFNAPAVVDNDAKAMALGEWWLGAGAGSRNMLGMVVSTGIGGGIVLYGRLLDGEHGEAGHIGHVVVEPDGPTCACGARGCVTAVASGRGIAERADEARARREGTTLAAHATAADVALAARGGDTAAAGIFVRAAVGLGRAIAAATSLLDLERVVIGGSIGLEAWDLLQPGLESELRARTRMPFARLVTVHRAGLGHDAGLVGAAALAMRPR